MAVLVLFHVCVIHSGSVVMCHVCDSLCVGIVMCVCMIRSGCVGYCHVCVCVCV